MSSSFARMRGCSRITNTRGRSFFRDPSRTFSRSFFRDPSRTLSRDPPRTLSRSSADITVTMQSLWVPPWGRTGPSLPPRNIARLGKRPLGRLHIRTDAPPLRPPGFDRFGSQGTIETPWFELQKERPNTAPHILHCLLPAGPVDRRSGDAVGAHRFECGAAQADVGQIERCSAAEDSDRCAPTEAPTGLAS